VCATLIVGVLAGTAILIGTNPSVDAAQEKALKAHWRYHDGHWSYWDDADRRWCYTDGTHWFYEDSGNWRVYPFDRQFGREGFTRETYVIPGENVKVILPRHRVYVPR